MDLRDRVALVTGASRGVGAAVAVALAEAGCHVALAARATRASPLRNPGTLEDTAERVEGCGRRALAIPVNLAREEEVEKMVRTALDHFGRLDVLVNNAAVTFAGDLEIPLKRHDLVMEINLRAPLLAMRAALPAMKAQRSGAILNVSSVAAVRVVPELMSYGVSKIALERLTADAAEQLRPFGIAVNCFRIDLPVRSEGFVANFPDEDHSTWEPCPVAAEGVLWMLRQPPSYSGRIEGMRELREREGIMASQV